MLGGCLFWFSGKEFPAADALILVKLPAGDFVGRVRPCRVKDVTGARIGAEVGDLVAGNVIPLGLESQG